MNLLQTLDTFALLFEQWGYPIIFLGSLIEITPFGWAVPGGVILVIAGYLANENSTLNLIPIILVGTFGAWVAFVLAYLLGSKTGMWLVNKLNQQKNAEFAKRVLKNNGTAILTTSMMANLTRFWISYIAGVEKINFWKFNIYAYVASVTWVSLMAILGYLAGYEKMYLKQIVSGVGILAWVFLAIAVFIIIKIIRHEYHHFIKDLPHEDIKKI